MKNESKLEEIENYRKEERKKELENIIHNLPKGVLEGILFSSIPVGIITGAITGIGLLISYFTKDNSHLQHPFFQAGMYGFVGSALDFVGLCLYACLPPNGGYEAISLDSPLDNISESMRKRKELKNMTQEEICSKYLSQ